MPASLSSHLETLGEKGSASKYIIVVGSFHAPCGARTYVPVSLWLSTRDHSLFLEADCIPCHVPHTPSSSQQWLIKSFS